MTCASVLTVTHSNGGLIALYAATAATVECVRIAGWCASACTLLLGAAQACMDAGATLGMHGPDTDPGPWRDMLVARMAAHYPPALAEWFLAGPADLRGSEFETLDAGRAEAMGVAICEDTMAEVIR